MLEIENKSYTNKTFVLVLKNITNISCWFSKEDDSIRKIGLLDKIRSVVGGWLGLVEDQTTPDKIDKALSIICEKNKELISLVELELIRKIAMRANLIMAPFNQKNSLQNEIRERTTEVHMIADMGLVAQ